MQITQVSENCKFVTQFSSHLRQLLDIVLSPSGDNL